MSFDYRFEPPFGDELDYETPCTYDKYCEGEFDCEFCKYNKGDDTMDYETKATLIEAAIENEFGPLDWKDLTLDDNELSLTWTGPTYGECTDEKTGELNRIKLLALQDGFFAKMHAIKRMVENCGLKVITFKKYEATCEDTFAEATIDIDLKGEL